MALTSRDHYRMLRLLLPPGQAFNFSDNSDFARLLRGLAAESARLDDTASGLLDELLPDTTSALLPAWEKVVGIKAPSGSIADRRHEVVLRLRARGGQSVSYFVSLAEAFGLTIEIREHRELIPGFECGDYVTNGNWPFAWRVYRRDGLPLPEDFLRSLKKLGPSHTIIVPDDPWERDAA